MNYQASGKASEIDGEIARRLQPADNNPHQVKFKEILRDFVKKVMGLYGSDSQVTILHNGAMDHGGGDMTMSMNILNRGGNPLASDYQEVAKKEAEATPENAQSPAQAALAGNSTSDTPPADTPSGGEEVKEYGLNGEPKNG